MMMMMIIIIINIIAINFIIIKIIIVTTIAFVFFFGIFPVNTQNKKHINKYILQTPTLWFLQQRQHIIFQ